MFSKRFLNIYAITVMCNLVIVNGFTNNITNNLNNNNRILIQNKNNNKTQVKNKQKRSNSVTNPVRQNTYKEIGKDIKNKQKRSNSVINTIKQSMYKEIGKDTKERSKSSSHVASFLCANLPKQLIEYMESALKNNKQIQEAQKEILATNEQHNIDRSALMPRITAENSTSTSNTYFNKAQNNMSYEYDKNNRFDNTTSLSVRYNIFHGGSDVANLKSTDKAIEAKWKSYDATIQKILQEVAQNYFALVAKQDEIKNINALLKARKENCRVIQDMKKAGNAKDLDVEQANTGLSEVELRLNGAINEEKAYKFTLEQLTGISITDKLEAPDKLFDKVFEEKEALDIAMKNNPQLIATIAEHAAAKAKLSVPNGEFLPSVDLVASGSRRFVRNKYYEVDKHFDERSSDKNTIYEPSVSLQLSWSLFNGLSSISKKMQQAYSVAKVAVTKDRIYTEIKKDILITLDRLTTAEGNIKKAKEMIKSQRIVLESTKKEHEAGTKLMKDILDAQQKLFEAYSTLTNAIRDRYINQCNLMALLGWFNPSDLKLHGLAFDYKEEYYKQIQRIIPTFEEMGINTMKPIVNNKKRSNKYNNRNNIKTIKNRG